MATALIQRTEGRLPAVSFRQISLTARRSIPPRHHAEVSDKVAPEVVSAALFQAVQFEFLERIEGDDAKITGGTRSLTRRVLALNLTGTLRPRISTSS